MTDAEFDARVLRTADGLSEDAARLYLLACDDWVEVDDVLAPAEEELVMSGLVSHVRPAGSRQYFLDPSLSSRWSIEVQALLRSRFPPQSPASKDE